MAGPSLLFCARATEQKNPKSDLRMDCYSFYKREEQKRRIQRVMWGWPVNISSTRASKEKNPKDEKNPTGDLRLAGEYFLHKSNKREEPEG